MEGNGSPDVTSSTTTSNSTVTTGKKKVVKKVVKKKVVKKTKSSDVSSNDADAPVANGNGENANGGPEVIVTSETSVVEVTSESATNGNVGDVKKPLPVGEKKKKAPPSDDPSNIETFEPEKVEVEEKKVSDVTKM